MNTQVRWVSTVAALVGIALTWSCGDTTSPVAPALTFQPEALDLALARTASVTLRNDGAGPAGPIAVGAGQIRDGAGMPVAVARAAVTPAEIPTLNPGETRTLSIALEGTSTLPAGTYEGALLAEFPAGSAGLELRFRVDPIPTAPSLTVAIVSGATATRQGDVAVYGAEVRDSLGAPAPGTVRWDVLPASAGFMTQAGEFVAYASGPVMVRASVGAAADSVEVDVSPRALTGAFSVRGTARDSLRFTSDLWLYDDVVYTGTWGVRQVGGVPRYGNLLTVWALSDPTTASVVDSVVIDARTLNDVKIRDDGQLAVLTHEASNDGANGITVLDLTDRRHPVVAGRFTASLETGVHNAWIDGDFVYLVVDGTSPTSGLRILDVSDPANPTVVSSFYAGTSFLHDVYVRDGLAFLSHWDAGLIILDVGNGIRDGSPAHPVEVSRIRTAGGETHNAWYWPAGGYVFVGEEDFSTPGMMHVIDVSDVTAPREVATLGRPTSPPHNFWLDETRGILYAAWYGEGLVAVDVTGELLGDLAAQGRVYASTPYGGSGSCPDNGGVTTCTWAPQVQNGLVYVSDMNRGLVVLQPTF